VMKKNARSGGRGRSQISVSVAMIPP